MEHPAEDVFLRFFLGTASRQENRQIVKHLLARCPSCAAALRSVKPCPVDPAEYDEALDRFAARLRELGGLEGRSSPRRCSGSGKACCPGPPRP